jgi:F-type H+-transporting ATPase subunit c
MKNFGTKLMVTLAATMVAAPAFAQEAATAATSTSDKGIVALAAALAIGIAAFGGAMAQGKAAAAALDGISRNPAASGKIMTPMIIGLALIESLVIYALVIAFKIS